MPTIPIDLAILGMILTGLLGAFVMACVLSYRRKPSTWPRYAPDYSELPALTGESERDFIPGEWRV